MLEELRKGSLTMFFKAVSENFKTCPKTVQDHDYVSYHLYLVMLWLWGKVPAQVTEAKVHALLTYIVERNVKSIFQDEPLKIMS